MKTLLIVSLLALFFAVSSSASADDDVERFKVETAFAAGYGVHYTTYQVLGKKTTLPPVVRWLIASAAAGTTAALMEKPAASAVGAAVSTAFIITFD